MKRKPNQFWWKFQNIEERKIFRPGGQGVRRPLAEDRFQCELHMLSCNNRAVSISSWPADHLDLDHQLTSSSEFNPTNRIWQKFNLTNHKIKDNKVGLSQHNRKALYYLYLHLSIKLCACVKKYQFQMPDFGTGGFHMNADLCGQGFGCIESEIKVWCPPSSASKLSC